MRPANENDPTLDPMVEVPGQTRLGRRRRLERVQERDYRNADDWLLMFKDRNVAREKKRNVIADIALGASRGVDEAGQSLAKFMGIYDELDSLGQWINEKSGGTAPGSRTEDLPETETIPGQLTEGFTQFLSIYLPLSTFGGAAGASSGLVNYGMGAVSDMLAFDPEDGNLSTLARSLGVDNAFTQWLDSTEGSEAEGRLKNMIEGLVLSGAVDSAVRVFRHAVQGGFVGPPAGSRRGQLGMFGGQQAQTRPRLNSDEWMQGADGNWRFEIDDSAVKFKAPLKEGMDASLDEIIDHPKLFEAYPELRNIYVSYQPMEAATKGGQRSLQNGGMEIRLNSNYNWPSEEDQLSTILHEVQHAVQSIEKFAGGGNFMRILKGNDEQLTVPEAIDVYRRLMGEVEARNVQTRMRMTPEMRGLTEPELTEDVARSRQLYSESQGSMIERTRQAGRALQGFRALEVDQQKVDRIAQQAKKKTARGRR